MADIPNLAGVATADLVDKIGSGNFQASYINWSRTMHLLRTHAAGWLPELVAAQNGGIVHAAPVGAFLLIRFRHADGTATPEVPQAIMDHRNAAIPFDKVTARDITDTHRRGVCMAAALTFGLAYELWAKVALESGYGDAANEPASASPGVSATGKALPTDGAWDAQTEEQQEYLLKVAATVLDVFNETGADDAHSYLDGLALESEEKIALWTRLDSKVRTALKKAHKAATERKEAA